AAPAPAAQRAPAVAGAAGAVGPQPPAAVVLSDDDGAADTAALSRAEPVLTETMAELYLRQGHQEDALRVYQALLAKRPADRRPRLQRRHRLRRRRAGSHSTSSSALPNRRARGPRGVRGAHARRPARVAQRCSRRRGAPAAGSDRRWRMRATSISSKPGSGAS